MKINLSWLFWDFFITYMIGCGLLSSVCKQSITPLKKKKLTTSTTFCHYCQRWLSSKYDFSPGRAFWHLQVGMLNWFWCCACLEKQSQEECLPNGNYKSSSILLLWELAKTFLFNLICWSILFLLSQQIFTFLQYFPDILGWLLGITMKFDFFFSLFKCCRVIRHLDMF